MLDEHPTNSMVPMTRATATLTEVIVQDFPDRFRGSPPVAAFMKAPWVVPIRHIPAANRIKRTRMA